MNLSDDTPKRCPRCGVDKTLADFGKNRARRDGHNSWCKECKAEAAREYNQRPEVKARAAERSLARYHELSQEERRAIRKRRTAAGSNLRTKYGITLEEYEALLDSQGGVCAICGSPPAEGRRMPVDHDHSCCPGETACRNCVRGILCITCNVHLGFHENEEWATRADEYLSGAMPFSSEEASAVA